MANQGRPRKQWTPAEVEQFPKLCGIFCTRRECAAVMGVDVRTLDKLIEENFPETPTWDEAFAYYSASGKATLRRKMFELAMNGDKAALIFMAKNYLGMSDNGLTDEKPQAAEKAKFVSMVGNSKWTRNKAANE